MRLKQNVRKTITMSMCVLVAFTGVAYGDGNPPAQTTSKSNKSKEVRTGETSVQFDNPTVGKDNTAGAANGPGGIVPTGSDGDSTEINIPNLPAPGGLTGGGFAGGGGIGGSGGMPTNLPYAPWDPWNSDGKPGMLAIQQTMVPGVMCPLVDNRPNPEILQAIQNLFQYVMPRGNCNYEKDQEKINALRTQMLESGKALQKLMGGAAAGTVDPSTVDAGQAQGQLNTLVSGLDQIGSVIGSNAAVGNARCNQMNPAMRPGEIIKSMGSLITSIAPYALMLAAIPAGGATAAVGGVATAGSAATVGLMAGGKSMLAQAATKSLKYLLGTFALGSVINTYSDLVESGSIDMEKPDQREALLQNLCEFYRIKQRVDFLKLADMGKIKDLKERERMVRQKLAYFKAAVDKSIDSSFPKQIQEIAKIEQDVSSQLRRSLKVVHSDQAEMSDMEIVNASNGKEQYDGIMCNAGLMAASDADKPNEFPGRTVRNYQWIMKQQKSVSVGQKLLLRTEANLREALKKKGVEDMTVRGQCARGTQCNPYQNCAAISRNYLKTISQIIADSDIRVRKLQESLNNQLNEHPDYKEFRAVQSNAAKEKAIREKASLVVLQLAGNDASVVKGEIDDEIRVLKTALFDKSSNYGGSPVYRWLEHTNSQLNFAVKDYDGKLQSLYKYARKTITPSGLMESYKQILDEHAAVNTLSMINPTSAPPGSQNNKNICEALTKMYLSWHSTETQMKRARFFCDSIKPLATMENTTVEKKITEYCFGEVNFINGQQIRKSTLQKSTEALLSKYATKVSLIDTKVKELNCEMPDVPGATQ